MGIGVANVMPIRWPVFVVYFEHLKSFSILSVAQAMRAFMPDRRFFPSVAALFSFSGLRLRCRP